MEKQSWTTQKGEFRIVNCKEERVNAEVLSLILSRISNLCDFFYHEQRSLSEELTNFLRDLDE